MLHRHKKDRLIFLSLLLFDAEIMTIIQGRDLKLSGESDFMEFLEENSLNTSSSQRDRLNFV